MMRTRWQRGWSVGALVVALAVVALAGRSLLRTDAGPLPDELSNAEFWDLVESFSEPSGYFQSENLVSNEHTYQYVVPALEAKAQRESTGPGGPSRVYLGVAPDQNFTYLLALKPQMAFIVDIRRGNLQTQLMYKALIELSADRVEFVSRLFARPRPANVSASVSVDDLFVGVALQRSDPELQAVTLEEMLTHLTVTRGFRLAEEDQLGIEAIYEQFVRFGPSLTYSSRPGGGFGRLGGRRGRGFSNFPSYADLMRQEDGQGVQRSYLASDAQYQALKALEERNLIVPVVGDFAGDKALREVGRYVREHGATVTAFYASNVEQYLFRNDVWRAFYDNLATLPVDDESVIIRSVSPRDGYLGIPQGPDGRANVLDPIAALVRDYRASKIATYYDVTSRVH
ncbi:MAG: hypothetical protein HQ485_04825 [Acidobacteria bacterium]|jgi:hypothetical protein|nr:hypothetical protein [Acidobacteriota bacterium]